MMPIIIFLLSIGLQLTAAMYALLLIRVTGRKLAWILISAAMVLMTWRRIVSFISIMSAGKKMGLDIPELIALVISVLMLLGVLLIRDYFRSINLADAERRRAQEEREKLILELREALAKVKKLSGLLPICASCKKIRNDKGYWEQIDVYIHEHSEAEFSHGLCPECLKKLYPEYRAKEDSR